MSRRGGTFVFGMLLLILGATMMIQFAVDLHAPVLPAAIAILFVLWGSQLVSAAWSVHGRTKVSGEAWLGQRTFAPHELSGDAKYDVVFGKGIIDLTTLPDPVNDVTVTVGTMFGAATVKVDPAIAYDVEVHEMLGNVRAPQRVTPNLDGDYESPTDHRPRLHLRLNTVLGTCRIEEVVASA